MASMLKLSKILELMIFSFTSEHVAKAKCMRLGGR